MGLSEKIERLEEQVADLRSTAEWKDEAHAEARRCGISEKEMEEIWLQAIGPRPCTCAEHLSAILEALPLPEDLESSDRSPIGRAIPAAPPESSSGG